MGRVDRVGVREVVRDLAVVGTRTPIGVEREVVLYRDEELAVLGRGRDADDVAGAAVGVVRRADDVVRVVRLESDVPPDAAAVGSAADGPAGVSSAPSPPAE